MAGVLIRGQGIAANCCAHLLDAAGIHVAFEPAERRGVPALVIGEATQLLACDTVGRQDLFDGLPRIEKRVVAWGPDPPVSLPHSAVVISEDELAARILQARVETVSEPGWQVYAVRPLPPPSVEQAFGTRKATAFPVTLNQDAATFWIESVAAGWLFLISAGDGKGWLLSIGGSAQSQLVESRVISPLIQEFDGAGATFPAYPRIANPLCGLGWLSCGAAAVSFDPLSGDGVGNAIREGILAAAVIRAAERGEHPQGLRTHYASRVIAGLRRHLELCRGYYRLGGNGPWWRAELEALEKGVKWCGRQLGAETFRYRLNGFDLERVE